MPSNFFRRKDSYVIAEVGQNHQGSLEEALRYVSVFANFGADAIKFQMRNNRILFDNSVYNEPYNSENSFGGTYGEHREALELETSSYPALKERCSQYNVDFIITPFDETSLSTCVSLEVDALKVASFDLGNISFLDKIGNTRIPVIISSGGGTLEHIRSSIATLERYHNNIALLHCVSKYPCAANEMRLEKISLLRACFPNLVIGLSDHFNGIVTGPIGYMLGARVFEKHVTFDRSSKGTDHPFSLEPDGFRRFVRDIKRTPELLTISPQPDLGNEPVFMRLGKSIIASADLETDQVIKSEHLSGKICRPTIIPVRDSAQVIGSILKSPIRKGQYITWDDIHP